MSKHCFHYGFARWLRLCRSWLRLRKMSETIAHPNQASLQCAGSPAQQSPHLTRQEQSPAQQAAPGFDHSSKGRSFMHESRFIGKQNLFSKICSAVASCSSAKLQHSATEYLRPEIAVAVAASSVRQILAGSRRSHTM